MYSKVEFILYSDYTPKTKTDAEITALAAAVYTDLYDCDMSATKTLGLTDYFGNEPKSFDFTLDYDSWLENNLIVETNDISKYFSKYIVRVYDGVDYVFSGVLELSYFNINIAKNKVKLKAYDWIVLINKIKDLNFSDATSGSGYFPKPYLPNNPNFLISGNLLEVSNFATVVICIAQSLIFGGFTNNSYSIPNLIALTIINPYTEIENIISTRENFQLRDLGFTYNKVNAVPGFWHDQGWVLNQSGRAVYTIIVFIRRQTNTDSFLIRYRTYRYNSINIEYEDDIEYNGEYGSAYFTTCINEVNNKYKGNTGTSNNYINSDGTQAGYYLFTTVTDSDTNIYTQSVNITNNAGDENIYYDIKIFCNYVTNGQSVLWKYEKISIANALKVCSVAGNGAFIITEDNLDEIKFISKYLDSETATKIILDDDICDDLQFSRVPKQGISIDDLKNAINETNANFLIDKFQLYYDTFFTSVNTKASFTISNIFNDYSALVITDKIVVSNKVQVINSIKKESDAFTKIESMNYLMDNWIDEIASPNQNYFVDELGNNIVFPAF